MYLGGYCDLVVKKLLFLLLYVKVDTLRYFDEFGPVTDVQAEKELVHTIGEGARTSMKKRLTSEMEPDHAKFKQADQDVFQGPATPARTTSR